MSLRDAAVFAAFRTRDYRFQWASSLAMGWAMEMETLILGWFVLVSTDSPFLTAVIGALHFGGTLLCPFSGVIADRVSRRTMLLWLRSAYAVLASAIMLLGVADVLEIWHLFVIAGLSGLLRPSDLVVRISMIADIVPRAHLRNAVGYERTTVDIARICGAWLGASLFAQIGLGYAYGAVVGFYLASFALTLGIHIDFVKRQSTRPWQDLKSGIRYMLDNGVIVAVMLLALVVNLVAFPLTHGLLPVLAREGFGVDANGLATLVMSFAIGALCGSLVIAFTVRMGRVGASMLLAAACWHGSVLLMAFTSSFWLAVALMALVGFVQSSSMVLMALLLLNVTAEEYRGRINGVRMLVIYALPIGLIAAGLLIESLGITTTLALYGVVGLVLQAAIVVRWPVLLKA